MFGWFKKKPVTGDGGQLAAWLKMLQTLDGSELGLPVAFAAHFRNKYSLTGRNFNKPAEIAHFDPDFVVRMIDEVHRLQASGLQYMAPGIMIWVHSFRAAHDLELRPLGRQMWGELARGFPFVEQAAIEVAPLTGFELDIAGYREFPEGLSPTPR
jgi:hypothetical protein